MQLIDLNGQWQMKRSDEAEWINAIVPGSVFNDLINAGKMEDPYFRKNEYTAYEQSRFDYEYRRSFQVDIDVLGHERVLLNCEGLDTICDIYINDKQVLNSDNMHRRYEADIKDILVHGENVIHVYIHSATNYIDEINKELFNAKIPDDKPGITHLRKALCMYGWDWGPKLGDMGIWRSISICGYDIGRIDDIYVEQEHIDDIVKLSLDIRLKNQHAYKPETRFTKKLQSENDTVFLVQVTVESPEGVIFSNSTPFSGLKQSIDMIITEPKLWWPNNLGGHPLYKVRAELLHDERILDVSEFCVGLRTITVKQEPDEWGESFSFEVNGESIFIMGADYIPEDGIFGRRSYEKTRKLIKGCADANYNMLRIWGGGHYPEDYLLDLCDEHGIIVWQDFMYACKAYELNDSFEENITKEAVDNIKRIRNHACIGLWCGNNEMEMLWANWGWGMRYGSKMQADYIKLFHKLLPELVSKHDPKTFYWPSSPSSGGFFNDPDNHNQGDIHYWDVWHGRKPLTYYRKIYPRFNSEFGIQSFPCLKTVEAFTLPEDRNIYSSIMESHQKDGTGNEKILHYIGDNFRYPNSFNSLLYASQLAQAEGMRNAVEHFRRNRGRCMGALIWQLNDCWPVASWALVDYYNRWKAAQYFAKRFYAPVLASVCEEGEMITVHVTNDTLSRVEGMLFLKLLQRDGDIIREDEVWVNIDKLSKEQFACIDFSEVINDDNRSSIYFAYEFISGGKLIGSGTAMFVKPKHFELKAPDIKAEVTETIDSYEISLISRSFAKFVELWLEEADALFSDNVFDMNAGVRKIVSVKKESIIYAGKQKNTNGLDEFKRQLRIRSLYDTYD